MEDFSSKVKEEFVKNFEEILKKIKTPKESSVSLFLVDDMETNTQTFANQYDTLISNLRKRIKSQSEELRRLLRGKSRYKGTPFVKKNSLEELAKRVGIAKLDVMRPAYMVLGADILKSNLMAEDMVNLMYQKQATSDQLQQVIYSLARWQILDELQQQLQPMDFSRCFEGFHESPGLGGRPEENLYDRVDKHRLRLTLEALHHERYSMTVKQGWLHSQARTKQFLLAFMLSLFKDLYGKMAAFHRFFTEVCGYTFIKAARTLQNWLSAYHEFVNERSRRTDREPQCEPQASHDRWMRQERKYTLVEELAKWMRGLLPHYGVSMA
jgi:hypothetical protein